MRLLLLSILITLSGPTIDGTKKGRDGNKKFYKEEFASAEKDFISGLEGSDPAVKNRTSSGLYNNLGCALNKQEKFDEAAAAFQNAVNTSANQTERSRALFNSGNNVVQMQQLDAALEFYKQALIADPSNEAARFNYEFISRMKDQQQDQNSGDNQQNQDEQKKQDQDQQDQDQQNQDQQQNQEQQNDQNDDSEDENQEPQEQQKPNQMSQEEAERILQKLQSDEKELLKQAKRMKGSGKKAKKDW